MNHLVAAREADPDMGFTARLLALCSLPRTNPGNRIDLDEWRQRPNSDAGGTAPPKPVTDRAEKGKGE